MITLFFFFRTQLYYNASAMCNHAFLNVSIWFLYQSVKTINRRKSINVIKKLIVLFLKKICFFTNTFCKNRKFVKILRRNVVRRKGHIKLYKIFLYFCFYLHLKKMYKFIIFYNHTLIIIYENDNLISIRVNASS